MLRRFRGRLIVCFVSEPLCVEQGIPGCASLILELVQEDTRGHARTHEIRRAMQREEKIGGIKDVGANRFE